jgi:hypothetical protein
MSEPLQVLLFEAKPNKLFTEEQTAAVRFLRYNQSVPCAECGKRSKHHWTVLYSFKATSLVPGMFTLQESGKVHLPLTPVCRDHPLTPASWETPRVQRKGSARAATPQEDTP